MCIALPHLLPNVYFGNNSVFSAFSYINPSNPLTIPNIIIHSHLTQLPLTMYRSIQLFFLIALVATCVSSQVVPLKSASGEKCSTVAQIMKSKGIMSTSAKEAFIAPSNGICKWGTNCRGFCIAKGKGFCDPKCTGASYCKGCNEKGYCKKKKCCGRARFYVPCWNMTIYYCKPIYFSCHDAPIVPWSEA